METFAVLLALCVVTGEFPAQRLVTQSFDVLICAWINGWVDHRKAGDLRHHRSHYNVTVMYKTHHFNSIKFLCIPLPLGFCCDRCEPGFHDVVTVMTLKISKIWNLVGWYGVPLSRSLFNMVRFRRDKMANILQITCAYCITIVKTFVSFQISLRQ